MPVKLLLYTFDWFPLVGGIQTVTLHLASGLAALRDAAGRAAFEVTLVTRTTAAGMDDTALPFRVVRRPSFGRLARLMHSSDIIHIANPTLLAMTAAWLVRKPTVVEHHGFQASCPNGLLFIESERVPCPGHYMAGRLAKCVACNRPSAGLFESLYMIGLTPIRRWLAGHARFNVVPTAWLGSVLRVPHTETIHHDVSRLSDFVAAAALTSPLTFAFLGRLVSTKGMAVLLRAAEILNSEGASFRLKILGDGPEMASLRAQAAPLGDKVELLGHVPDQELEAVLAGVAAVVMPSLGGEVFGLVAAENMLRGKLLIVSDIGALAEVVGDSGLVFVTGDAEALARCMRSVIERPALATELGAKARTRAMQLFARDSMIERHVSLYREALRR